MRKQLPTGGDLTIINPSILPSPPQACLVFLCGGCRTQSSMILVSTSTVTSTHHMLRLLYNGVVGANC